MSYIENGIAMFNNSARRTFIEYAQSYREKDANYLHGTTLLKNRVVNGLVEMMMSELSTEMNRVLREHRMLASEEYSKLKLRLSLYYDDYVSRFRNLEFDIDNHHPNL